MSNNNIELTRRRVLGGIATVGAASAAVGAGTFAAFSDTEESSGNSVTAGTLDLDSAANTQLTLTNIKPGFTTTGETVATSYSSDSTLNAEISLGLSLVENDDGATEPTVDNGRELTATEFAQKIRVDSASIGDGNNSTDLTNNLSERTTGHPPDGSGGQLSYIDLDQLAQQYDTVLSNVANGTTITLSLNLSMPIETGNAAQADGVNLAVSFIADQQS